MGININEELIVQLRKEQESLIPKDSIRARGFGKTYIELIRFLTFVGYELYCQIVEQLETEETLESAHNWIMNYVEEMFQTRE